MPRWHPAVAVVSLLVLLGVGVRQVFFLETNPRITKANFAQIKAGMSRAEVEAILGPPGDYRTGPTVCLYSLRLPTDPPPPANSLRLQWRGDDTEIWLWVDPQGVVLDRSSSPMLLCQSGTMDWLTWRWHRLRNEDAP
jgi:hypothetical protein